MDPPESVASGEDGDIASKASKEDVRKALIKVEVG